MKFRLTAGGLPTYKCRFFGISEYSKPESFFFFFLCFLLTWKGFTDCVAKLLHSWAVNWPLYSVHNLSPLVCLKSEELELADEKIEYLSFPILSKLRFRMSSHFSIRKVSTVIFFHLK